MASSGMRVSVPPINQIYKQLVSGDRAEFWLIGRPHHTIEGRIRGFDEYMNVVLDEAEEISGKKQVVRVPLGRLLLKGDNICLIKSASPKIA
jgi:small nuclear ribonucleoprotein E